MVREHAFIIKSGTHEFIKVKAAFRGLAIVVFNN